MNREQEIKRETKKMASMTDSDLDLSVRAAACRQYEANIQRAVTQGAIWTKQRIKRIYPIVLQILDELEVSKAQTAYEDAKFQLRQTKRKYKAAAQRLAK